MDSFASGVAVVAAILGLTFLMLQRFGKGLESEISAEINGLKSELSTLSDNFNRLDKKVDKLDDKVDSLSQQLFGLAMHLIPGGVVQPGLSASDEADSLEATAKEPVAA